MKRYSFYAKSLNGNIPLSVIENNQGEYVQYEDVQALIQWMKEKAEEWQNNIQSWTEDEDYDTGYESGAFRCGDEVEQKLREIGEL